MTYSKLSTTKRHPTVASAIITTEIRRPHNQLFRQSCQYVINYCIDVAEEVSPTAVSYEHFRIPRTSILLLDAFHISVAQHSKRGLGRLTVEVSRSHTIRHTHTHTQTRCDSSAPVISPSQRPLPTQHINTKDEHSRPQRDPNSRS